MIRTTCAVEKNSLEEDREVAWLRYDPAIELLRMACMSKSELQCCRGR